MKITPYKNNYGYYRVKCPFCGKECYFRESTKISPDSLRDLKRHITNQAKNEALNHYVLESNGEIEHLKYYKEHTKNTILMQAPKRNFDNDLELKS